MGHGLGYTVVLKFTRETWSGGIYQIWKMLRNGGQLRGRI